MTVGAAIFVAWVVGRAGAQKDREVREVSIIRTTRQARSRGAIAALMLLGLFLVCYVVMILTWEDFAYSDNSMFTLYTLRGHDLAPPILRASGRFYPLGSQEFNLIRHFTSTVTGYHVLPIAQLLIFSAVLLILDDELDITARVALTTVALIILGSVISFTGLIYEERNVLFCLACLALFVKRFEQTRSTAWAVAAAVCAQVMIYYKETACLLLMGFAIGRLMLRCKHPDLAGWDYSRLRDKESRLDLCLASLGVLFLLYYVAVMIPHLNMQYAAEWRLPPTQVLITYLRLDLLVWLFVTFVVGRTYLILRHRAEASLLWDGLALGGVACFAAYLYLGIYSAYYLAPVDLIAVLYVGRLAILSWGKMRWWSKAASLILLVVVALQGISLSAFRIFERKNVIHGKAEIASVVKVRHQNGVGAVQRVFFPFASPYRVMEFASYLSYRGAPVEGVPVEVAGLNSIVVVSRAVAKDGPCMGYASPICHAGSRPDPGDLVIVLPDDDASLAEVVPYRDGGELIFSYEPRPHIPHWLRPLVSHLHVASYAFAHKKLPDRWPHASVTVWK